MHELQHRGDGAAASGDGAAGGAEKQVPTDTHTTVLYVSEAGDANTHKNFGAIGTVL